MKEPSFPTCSVRTIDRAAVSFARGAAACLLIAICLFPGPHARAQTALSIEQCLSAGRAHNTAAEQAGLRLRAAELAHQQIITGRKPQVQFSAGAAYAPGTKRFGYDPALSDMGQLRSQVIIEQILYDGGRLRAEADRASLDITALTKEQALSIADQELAIRDAFVAGLRAQDEEALRRDALDDLTNYLQVVNALHAGGTTATTDVLRTRVERATAQVALKQAHESLIESRLSLAELMGAPGDTAFVLEGALSDESLLGTAPSGFESPLDSAASLDIAAADVSWRQALSDINQAKKESRPTISLVADAGYLTSRDNLTMPAAERYRGTGFSIGASFDLPLFDWGRHRLNVQQRTLEADAARLQINLIQRTLDSQHRTAVTKITLVESQLDTIRAAITTAKDNYVLTKAEYAAGGALASEVLSARQLVTETRLTELESLAQLQSLRAVLTRLDAH